MVMHPSLILADEPTGNLDQRSGQEVVRQLEELNSEGITLVVVTHDEQMGKRAKRQIRLVDGHIASGDTDSLEPGRPSSVENSDT